MTKNVLILVGSIRKKSFNQTLANYIGEQLRASNLKTTFGKISDLPMMNQDIEFPVPLPVNRLRKQVEQSDAIWIVSPEYNGTIPGVLKNTLDWLSRPIKSGTFGAPEFLIGKKVLISGAGGKTAASGSINDLIKLTKFMGLDPLDKTVGLQIPTSAFMSDRFEISEVQKQQIIEQIKEFQKNI